MVTLCCALVELRAGQQLRMSMAGEASLAGRLAGVWHTSSLSLQVKRLNRAYSSSW